MRNTHLTLVHWLLENYIFASKNMYAYLLYKVWRQLTSVHWLLEIYIFPSKNVMYACLPYTHAIRSEALWEMPVWLQFIDYWKFISFLWRTSCVPAYCIAVWPCLLIPSVPFACLISSSPIYCPCLVVSAAWVWRVPLWCQRQWLHVVPASAECRWEAALDGRPGTSQGMDYGKWHKSAPLWNQSKWLGCTVDYPFVNRNLTYGYNVLWKLVEAAACMPNNSKAHRRG